MKQSRNCKRLWTGLSPTPDWVRPDWWNHWCQGRQDGSPDAGTPRPPLQSVERPITETMECGGKSDGLESGQMQTREDL